MPVLIPRMTARPSRHHHLAAWTLALGFLLLPCCKPAVEDPAARTALPADDLEAGPLVASARWETAREKLAAGAPGEALALLASALASDPTSVEIRELARAILRETVWHAPETTIEQGFPIDRLELSDDGQLWVSLSDGFSTTVRWDLETLEIASILFPVIAPGTDVLVADSGHRHMVIRRADVTLLCDARALRPIRELGPLPVALTPSAVVTFSPDGLLLAHPVRGGNDSPVTWHIRDSASGEVLRTWEEPTGIPRPLAAHLDRQRLRLLSENGSLIDIPVSPVEEIGTFAAESALTLLHAHFLGDGTAAWVAENRGRHEDAERSILSFGTRVTPEEAAEVLRNHHPWNRHPGVWTGLFRDDRKPPIEVGEDGLRISGLRHPPIRSTAPITSAIAANAVIIGDAAGTISIHRLLPLPGSAEGSAATGRVDAAHATEFGKLALALAGMERDDASGTFLQADLTSRQAALDDCDLEIIGELFPELDFTPLAKIFDELTPRASDAGALIPLHQRLYRAGLKVDPAATPRAFTRTIPEVFASGNSDAIEAAIRSAGGKGGDAAAALALSLESDRPEWVRACIEVAEDLPPLLSQVARSRIAWLEGRKGDALAGWRESIPNLPEIRRREDWDGWEQADFAPALKTLEDALKHELAALDVPEAPDAAQRQAILQRLTSADTLAIVGRDRLAAACLRAALVFSPHAEESESTFKLATLARQLGAPASPCLRAEAMALTAMGDFKMAQSSWITLITEHPMETHQPGDYAEAAYTSFENDDSRQALEILRTGMRHYPQDGAFAIRAGWVALLIGNAERAYEFLLMGERIGFPEDKLENAIALLAIAAAQSGYSDDAQKYFESLVLIDLAWANPETLETLEWPEALKGPLRQLTWGPAPSP